MKKILFIGLILLMGLITLVSADWTPQEDINLRNTYQIINATNISATYYCNATACYTIGDFLLDTGADYYAGGVYIYLNGSDYFILNETKLNATISSLSPTYTNLSQLIDDLGDRGYTSLSNFSNDPGYYNESLINASELEHQGDSKLGILDSFINTLIDNRVVKAFIKALGFYDNTEVYNKSQVYNNTANIDASGYNVTADVFKGDGEFDDVSLSGDLFMDSSNDIILNIDNTGDTGIYADTDDLYLQRVGLWVIRVLDGLVEFDEDVQFNDEVQFYDDINGSGSITTTDNITSDYFFGWLNWSWLKNTPDYILTSSEGDLNVNYSDDSDKLDGQEGAYYLDDTTIGNCSGDGSCSNIIYQSELPLANETTPHCSNITGGPDDDFCTDATGGGADGNASSICSDNEVLLGQDTATCVSLNDTIDDRDSDTYVSDQCSAGDFVKNITGDTMYCDTPAGGGDITGVNTTDDPYLLGGVTSGEAILSINETKLNNTINALENDTTYTNGSGISLVGTEFNHSDTSSQASDDNSGNTFIQDIILDGFGHITSIVNAAVDFSAYVAIADLVGMVGNWSADKADYWNASTDLDDVIATDEITELKIDFNTACAAGNHLYVSGNNLACESDDDTTYSAGANLSLDGTTFSLDATNVKSWLDTLYAAIGDANPFGSDIEDTEMNAEDFGEFTCTGDEDGCTLDANAYDDEYYDSEGDLTTLLDDNYEPISAAHFDATTLNITCFNEACTWFNNATDSCMYWPSGGKDCGAA